MKTFRLMWLQQVRKLEGFRSKGDDCLTWIIGIEKKDQLCTHKKGMTEYCLPCERINGEI